MGFAGPAKVEWPDIDAFIRRSGLSLAPWEIEMIEALDDVFLEPTSTPAPAAPDQAVTALTSVRDGIGVKAIMGSVGNRVVVRRKK